MTNTALFDNTHKTEMSMVKTDKILIMRLEFEYLFVTIVDENKSHLEKNKQPEIKHKAQKLLKNTS
jgi:hypothetical protein